MPRNTDSQHPCDCDGDCDCGSRVVNVYCGGRPRPCPRHCPKYDGTVKYRMPEGGQTWPVSVNNSLALMATVLNQNPWPFDSYPAVMYPMLAMPPYFIIPAVRRHCRPTLTISSRITFDHGGPTQDPRGVSVAAPLEYVMFIRTDVGGYHRARMGDYTYACARTSMAGGRYS